MELKTNILSCILLLALGVGVGGEEQKVDKIPLINIPWLVLSIVILFVGIILCASISFSVTSQAHKVCLYQKLYAQLKLGPNLKILQYLCFLLLYI